MKKAKKQNKAVDWIEKDIIITDEFLKAFESIEKTSDHIFLTGRAGTGKSTLLKYFRSQTKKKYVVLAPTGVAALNVKGQTIHSFFGFHPKINKHRVRKVHQDKVDFFKKIETIVIDEVSMVRTDLLDCVDRALRLNRERPKEKFGGVQMIFVGDLFQLPPVVTKEDKVRLESEYSSPYFFSSDVIKDFQIHIIELEIVYRQKEKDFLELLNNIRSGKVLSFDKEKWNQRHDPFFELMDDPAYVVHLTTTNKMAKERNDYEPTLEVELEDGDCVDVDQHRWDIFEYDYKDGSFEEGIVGSYMQYPIALAWAVTIHKAQGKTFDHVLIDVGWGAFAHGQMYVALSRCTTLKGITLLKPFQTKDVIVDQAVLDFMDMNRSSFQ